MQVSTTFRHKLLYSTTVTSRGSLCKDNRKDNADPIVLLNVIVDEFLSSIC